MTIGLRGKATVAVLAAALALAAAPAGAGTHGFVALQFGLPLAPGPPVYYYPPPAYYYPPPAYYPPPPAATSAGLPQQKDCHEYQTTAVIEGKQQRLHGTACLQPDGTWRITQ